MGGFTKINLKEIEAGGSADVEARFARSDLNSEHLGLSLFRYGPNTAAALGIATASRKRSTSSSAAQDESSWTTRSSISNSGMWCGSRRARCVPSRAGHKG